jgi:hypothetical protein
MDEQEAVHGWSSPGGEDAGKEDEVSLQKM